MTTCRRLLVPLAGTEVSQWLLSRTARLLGRPDQEVTFLGVAGASEENAEDPHYRADSRHAPLRKFLAGARDELLGQSFPAAAKVRFGDPTTEILREIAGGGYDLAVMATHARTGISRALLGSVAQAVLRASPVPILLLRPRQDLDESLCPEQPATPIDFHRILVPLDGSEAAEEILPHARSFARATGAKLFLFRVIHGGVHKHEDWHEADQYLAAQKGRLGGHDLVAHAEVGSGPASGAALEFIKDLRIDAVAMTTHARTGLARMLLGSVAERVLREGGVPVLTLRISGLREPLPGPVSSHRFVTVA